MTELTGVARWRLLAIVTVVSVVLDQWTKRWAVQSLRPVGVKTVIRGYFDLRFSLNTGAAWSFLADAEPTFRRWFFLGATLIAMALIGTMYRRAQPDQKAFRWALALLFGGAVGNFIDRVRSGTVIDFLSFHFKGHYYPTFNVADIAITVGLLLLAFDMLTAKKKGPQTEAAAESTERARRRRRKR